MLIPAFMLVDRLENRRPSSKTRQPMGGIVDGDPVVVFSDQPCRLDMIAVQGDPREAGLRQDARRVIYAGVDLDVQIGDRPIVTRPNGDVISGHRVKSIDKPGLFRPDHLEIEIEPIGATA